MFLNVIAVINIMNIVIIHLSYARYQLLLLSINILKRPSRTLQPIAYIHICAYAIQNISFNRKINSHIYLSIMCRSIFDVHQMN